MIKGVFTPEQKKCLICGSRIDIHLHHIFNDSAERKQRSEEDGFLVPLCPRHHHTRSEGIHHNAFFDLTLKGMAQRRYEKTHSREEFVERYDRSYIK